MLSIVTISSAILAVSAAKPGYVKYDGVVEPKVLSARPHTYLKSAELPSSFDWRNINGTNYCSRTLNQKNPNVCGSCWAEAVTGALSDRYIIATKGKAQIQLAPQVLINFNARQSGGSCNGGDHLKAYDFMSKYGMVDDACAPYFGLNWQHGFEVAAMTDVDEVKDHMCYSCLWNGVCGYVKNDDIVNYGVDEFGEVNGEDEMMAEIYARGPIACLINSEASQFNDYKGGVIVCDKGKECKNKYTDHVIVVAGWGVEASTGLKYWIGRNSYGTQWGEGAGGGWFRLERGVNSLGMEGDRCTWATPAKATVDKLLSQYDSSL